MSRKEEEYLRRQRELGYVPSLDGLDEEDLDYVPSWAQGRQPSQPLAREYRPVDRDFAERIFNMFKRPFDPNWQMPDLGGPEYRQPPKPKEWFDPEKIETLPYIPGDKEPRIWAEPYKPGSERDVPLSYGTGADPAGFRMQPASEGAGQEGGGTQARSWRESDMPSRAGSDRQEAWRRYGEMENAYKEPQYKQGYYDESVWKSPEVQGAQTREEREAAINRIIDSPGGEDLRKHYLYTHGNETDAALARQNDARYILDAMDGSTEIGNQNNNPGHLSAQEESNNNPGEVSTGNGDLGGKSYGLYQFSRDKGIADNFVKWLSDNNKDFSSDLNKWPVGSEQFDQAWQKIARDNPTKFAALQTEYAKGEYYDKAASQLRNGLGFDVSQRSPALQSVLWSRAVHYNPWNMPELFKEAADMAGEPLSTISDEKLIHNIYEFLAKDAEAAYHVGNGMYHSPKDWVNGSNDVVAGLHQRFLREREAAQKMLRNPKG